MKVAIINSVYNVGSTGRIVKNLYESLISDNCDVKLFYGRKQQVSNDENIIYSGSNLSTLTDVAKSLIFDTHGNNNEKNTLNIIEQLERFDPDIINIHNIHGFYLNLPLIINYCKKSRAKIVITLHDEWLFTGFCGLYTTNNCDKWKTGCLGCKIRRTYPYRIGVKNTHQKWLEKKELFSNFSNLTIVVPSKWLANEVKQSFLSDIDIKVINNGIDLKQFQSDEVRDSNIVLAVSNIWSKAKGIDEYIKLSKILPNNYQLVMIGVDKFLEAKLPSNIKCVKRTESIKELVDWYSKAHCLCNLSLDENFPTVDIEALSCGLPIVSYNVGGGPEIIGNCGIVIEKYNIEEIVKSIINLEKNDDLMKLCKKRAVDKFSQEKMCKNYKELFYQITK